MLGYLLDDLANAPELPPEMAHVWRWFVQLHATRGHGQGGDFPITYGEMAAWAALTGARPTAYEALAIRAIDDAYLTPPAQQKKANDDGN